METRLVELDQDHPGFRDRQYRTRRDFIAKIALRHQTGEMVPTAPYTEEEHHVWQKILATLEPLHRKHVCRALNEVSKEMALDRECIPQLRTINRRLADAGGFRMEPVAGLVAPRIFLEKLADKVFLSTQYIRHYSRPLYTPEPDVVHELVGHAASLIQPDIVALNVLFGQATLGADEETVQQLIRVFWYTLEFGALEEDGEIKAYGAGLLSSAGELTHFMNEAELRTWDIDRIAHTPFDPTTYQPYIYIAPSFNTMVEDLTQWLTARAALNFQATASRSSTHGRDEQTAVHHLGG